MSNQGETMEIQQIESNENAAMEQEGSTDNLEELLSEAMGKPDESVAPAKNMKKTTKTSRDTDYNSMVQDVLQDLDKGSDKSVEDQPKGESEDKELTTEEIMKKLNDGEIKEEDEETQETTGDVSKMIIDHKGEKVTIEGDKIKELVQQGFDYTQKTQKLAEQSKETEKEYTTAVDQLQQEFKQFDEQKVEFNEQIKQKQQWDFALDAIRQDDPDFYDQIQDKFNTQTRFMSNPVVNNQIAQLTQQLEELKEQSKQTENSSILRGLDSEMESVKSEFKAVSALGLKPNWDGLKETWQQGDKSFREVFLSKHGSDINKLYESKLKLMATKNKTKKSPTIGSIAKVPEGVSPGSSRSRSRVVNHFETVNKLLRKL